MGSFQYLRISRFLAKKIALTSVILSSILMLTACTGDDLNDVTTNADGSIKISDADAETAKNELGMSTLPNVYMVELNWDPPTSKSNGSPLGQNEIKEYRITYFKEGAEASTKSTLIISNSVRRMGIPFTEKGTYRFQIITVDTQNRESDPKLVTASL